MGTEATDILEYMKTHYERQHWYPTQREIALACHLATSTVNKYLSVLEARGCIVREPMNRGRRYYVVDNQ